MVGSEAADLGCRQSDDQQGNTPQAGAASSQKASRKEIPRVVQLIEAVTAGSTETYLIMEYELYENVMSCCCWFYITLNSL